LSREDFFAGRWQEALRAVVKLDRGEEPPPPTGADEAADILLKYL
jgi:hypothetical protein